MQQTVSTPPRPAAKAKNHASTPALNLVLPGSGYVSATEAMLTWLGIPACSLMDLGSLPAGSAGHRVLALRYVLANGETWQTRFAWRAALEAALKKALPEDTPEATINGHLVRADEILDRVKAFRQAVSAPSADAFAELLPHLGELLTSLDAPSNELLGFLWCMETQPARVTQAQTWLRQRAPAGYAQSDPALDICYLAINPITSYPATTVSVGQLKHIIIADKGEMGTRAVREALALKKTPVVLYSLQDDQNALQVRLAKAKGGFVVGLAGNFRESYANYVQIADKVKAAFKDRFKGSWEKELARAGIYPGYGPLAENAAAIRHFRREGLVFVGPMQDVVENAGDKRKFRRMAQTFNPKAVTPGIIIDADDAATIQTAVEDGFKRGDFTFPGRLKAANGGGGRGQVVIQKQEDVPAAIQKVLGEIRTNGWDNGVMFEQNIPETIHLEVQVLRDRYGNTRHFGMRDCSEQRASQKIQEEAPPALLAINPGLEERITGVAVQIADAAGYVGAGTVELMFKEGKFYFLEMNTRIQVEHPVTEETLAIDRAGDLESLNLVRWQMKIADGACIDFEQSQVVKTHVAREFRINAECWAPDLKDARDGGRGMFLPNAGVFDEIALPDRAAIQARFAGEVADLRIRFDCGFEAKDVLVNKDPTFGKLIVAVQAKDPANAYEVLRLVSLAVLREMVIKGRQVMPDGKILDGTVFKTNIQDHLTILEMPVLIRHSNGDETGRHVNWVVKALREKAAS